MKPNPQMTTEMTKEELAYYKKFTSDVNYFMPKDIKKMGQIIELARQALALERENEELRKCKKRLDWSIKHHQTFSNLVWDNGPFMDTFNVYSSEVYKAIDKAMSGE